jgi:hypothetical protein
MKKQKKGDARGRPNARSSFLAHPDAKFFCGKSGIGSLGEKEHGPGTLGEIFSFCFSSLAERGRSGPQQSRGAPFSGAGASAPLDGEDRCGIMS